MRSFRSEPFLWIHISGLAALPITLGLCWIFLTVGEPLLPGNWDLFSVAIAGIVPVLWMQLTRPFYIFSILVLALNPEQLTPVRRKILNLFKTRLHRVIAVATAIFLFGVIWQIYSAAPIAVPVAPFLREWRAAWLLLAIAAFGASNLFLQVPFSVAAVLFTGELSFAATEPLTVEQIQQDFTIPGVRVERILPNLTGDAKPNPTPVLPTPEASATEDPASSSFN